jgi:hypothetical protein
VDGTALRRIARKFLFIRIFNGLVDFGANCGHVGFRLHALRLAPSCFHSASRIERGARQEAD